ncbi:uncharacterized protein [Primulina eburnea]|uniref:uncharacterized protein n=1 Tax=Primulina eburnea TaxID=1245227 RepID=UPI003C6C95B3
MVWLFTGFYGHPVTVLRHFSWDLLYRLREVSELKEIPWLVGGDFNEIFFDSEKLGGNMRAPTQMQAFREALDFCELQDLHCSGEFFTWVNCRESNRIMFERLDRFVAYLKWRLFFPAARATSLEFFHSDHRPICMRLKGDQINSHTSRGLHKSMFRFEKGWLLEDDCREVIEQGWGGRGPYCSILERMESCKNALICWDNNKIRKIPRRLRAQRKKLNDLRTSSKWIGNMPQIKELEIEIENLATKEEMNQILCAPFTETEVRRALFDMHPDKAPGPDGFSTLFFQKFWEVVRPDVSKEVLRVLNEGVSVEAWNNTLVTLIPKVKDPSAFIPGRLITDNIIVGFEILHWMRTRKTGRSSYAALKLDMSKAYDRVEWEFLRQIMEWLGFDESWIARVMNCVTSVSYSFRVNLDVVGPIIPSRGLRQGDPLSPYLFVLYDSLVFFRATMQEGARVKECLTQYEKASGQLINYEKSALSFSPNSSPALMATIKTILTIPVVHQHDLYLGLPTVSMRSKRLQFKYLLERVVKRIQGWSHKWFSTGGKELWRLIRFPDSLAARVIKGRYFKHGSVPDAGLGSNPSIWRSILWSKEILERGLIWRVGDGKSIKIFKDKWIPTMQSKIGEPMGTWDKEATVNDLINQGVWNVDLISTRFNPYVAGEILNIPIRPT